MALDLRSLLDLDIPERFQTYGPRDCGLYALGVGVGADPLDEGQLAFLIEAGMRVLPSMAVVLAFGDFWLSHDVPGIDATRVLHGEQGLRLVAPLPTAATVSRKIRVTGVIDKGADRGGLVLTEENIRNVDTGELLAVLTSTIMCRADGGSGSAGLAAPLPYIVPDRAPDHVVAIPTFSQQALLYRLSGDLNPLHAQPDFARAAGFPGPVLHGLATYGMACQMLLRLLCEGRSERFRTLDARFTRPVFPGEPLDLLYWIVGQGEAAFQVRVPGRDLTALDNGRFTFAN